LNSGSYASVAGSETWSFERKLWHYVSFFLKIPLYLLLLAFIGLSLAGFPFLDFVLEVIVPWIMGNCEFQTCYDDLFANE
jgi:hypothetical protein